MSLFVMWPPQGYLDEIDISPRAAKFIIFTAFKLSLIIKAGGSPH